MSYIKIDRCMRNWGWYKDPPTKSVFLELLLTASYKDAAFLGEDLHSGEAAFSIRGMAASTGLSEQNVRTAIKHLQNTGEITVRATGKYSVATINNWSKYQDSQEEPKLPISTRKTEKTGNSSKMQIPPARDDVLAYVKEKDLKVDIDSFYDYYDSTGWKVGRNKMKDWKATLRRWSRTNFGNEANVRPVEKYDF